MDFLKNSKNALNKAAKAIKEGGVVVFPTDTVYGFLADASNKKAVEKIYKIKKRPRSKPLAVFVKDMKMAKQLAEITLKHEKILKKYWPGPYTFVLKAKRRLETIALRVPKYKPLNDLLKKINKPLVQTSVNISGRPAITKIEEIKKTFGSNSAVGPIFDAGNLPKHKPSVIMDLSATKIKILRK